MPTAPFLAAGTLVVASATWLVRLGFDPGPLATPSAVVVGVDQLVLAVVAAAGILIPRGRWARNLGYVVVAFQLGLALAFPLDGWAAACLLVSGLALVALAGPWLRAWLRRLPPVGSPPFRAVLTALGLLALPAVAALAAPSGMTAAHIVLAVAGVVLAWGYSQAHLWGLWGVRIGIAPLVAWAMAMGPWPGSISLGVYAATLVVMAWGSEARLAVSPLMDSLPGPRYGSPRLEADR